MITIERFTGIWCAPCRLLAPMLEDVKKSYSDNPNVVFTVVDIDEHPDKAEDLGIRSVPTVVIYRNGVEVNRIVGAQSRPIYVNAINEQLNWVQ